MALEQFLAGRTTEEMARATGLTHMGDDDAAVQAYYARDNERDRLEAGVGRLEFLRTVDVIDRDPAARAGDDR